MTSGVKELTHVNRLKEAVVEIATMETIAITEDTVTTEVTATTEMTATTMEVTAITEGTAIVVETATTVETATMEVTATTVEIPAQSSSLIQQQNLLKSVLTPTILKLRNQGHSTKLTRRLTTSRRT